MAFKDTKNADAFLNLTIKTLDANGNATEDGKRLQKGIALSRDTALGRQLIEAMEADENFSINLVGTVHIVPDEAEQEQHVFA